MLEKLVARNFKNHKHRVIKFRKRVTYLTGPNDAGKSNLLRLLKWIALNQRSRSAVIRWGAKSGSGTLHIDGRCVRRSTDGRGNMYTLDKKEFKAFRKDVPPEIQQFLNLSDLNFQGQRENTFWFDLSPSELARELNKLVDLEAIDKIQSKATTLVRRKKMELEVCEKRLKAAEEKVKHLKPILLVDRKLGKLEKLYSRYRGTGTKSHKLGRLRDAIAGLCGDSHRTKSGAVVLAVAIRAGAVGSVAIRAGYRAEKLRKLTTMGGKLEQVQAISIPDLAGRQLLPTKDLRHLVRSIEDQESRLCQCTKKVTNSKTKLDKRLAGRCPCCGGILTDRSPI